MIDSQETINTLRRGELVVMKSDTIYGIFALASSKEAVERLHKVRGRAPNQGFIVLVDSIETIEKIVDLRQGVKSRLANIWAVPFATSVILSAKNAKESWLADTRSGKPTICFRLPNNDDLRKLLKETGPLCAPSANLPDQLPARNIHEAKDYFGDKVRLYVDGGPDDNSQPSRIIRFNSDQTVDTVRPDGNEHPEDFVITRRRKLYKFAKFDEFENCFHYEQWLESGKDNLSSVNDLTVEIGAGSALFSVELARQNPKRTFVAIDIKGDRLYQGARKARELGIDNIYFVRSDISHVNEIIPDHLASEVWITFPDPYPRKPDAKHRLTAPRYLAYYRKMLSPGAKVNFKTDSSPLFEWSLDQFKYNGWQSEAITRDLHDSDVFPAAKIMTTYERKFVTEGQKINFAQFV